LFFIFRFSGATAHPAHELPHPLQDSDLLNDFNDFNALIAKKITAIKTAIHVRISCIATNLMMQNIQYCYIISDKGSNPCKSSRVENCK